MNDSTDTPQSVPVKPEWRHTENTGRSTFLQSFGPICARWTLAIMALPSFLNATCVLLAMGYHEVRHYQWVLIVGYPLHLWELYRQEQRK